MNRTVSLGILGIAMSFLFACSPSPVTTPEATGIVPQITPTQRVNTPTPTTIQPTSTSELQDTQTPASFLLSQPGPYFGGNKAYTFVDESRDGRIIEVVIWYPALQQTNANGQPVPRDAQPDMSGAPYPLILTEGDSGGLVFQSHFASHGFVMAKIMLPDHDDFFNWDFQMVEWPRDFVFILDQIASNPPEGLEGVIDTDTVGATGYSYGGDISLTLSGVRIDPEYYLAHCAHPPAIESKYGGAEWYLENTCGLAKKWDEFTEFVGDEMTSSEDGLWQPVTDERIRAVMPMAPAGTWLYGERGLASADRPVFMVAATEDEFAPYQEETVYLFEHLGAPTKSLVTFIGKSHMMVFEVAPQEQIKHFATAFFGYHLQGRADYQEYFSQGFISQFEDLYWGVSSSD